MVRAILAAALSTFALAACSASSGGSPTKPSTTKPASYRTPAAAAIAGKPKPVRYPSGQTATITLNGVRYAPLPGAENDGLSELAVVDVTIKNTSAKALPYDEDQLAFGYSDAGNPYTHSDDANVYGPALNEVYTPFMPPDPLRVGSLQPRKSVRGLVILRMSNKAAYVLIFSAPDLTTDLAEWALNSK